MPTLHRRRFLSAFAASAAGAVLCGRTSTNAYAGEQRTRVPMLHVSDLFPPEAIAAACQECHEEHIAWPRDVLARWRERCPEKTDFAALVCTDCHGEHRLERRVVRWDKRTGELILCKPKEAAGEAKTDEPWDGRAATRRSAVADQRGTDLIWPGWAAG